MSIFEYDQEAVLEVRAKDAFEDGRAAGRDEERKNTEAANDSPAYAKAAPLIRRMLNYDGYAQDYFLAIG